MSRELEAVSPVFIPVCLINFIVKYDIDKAIYNCVYHAVVVDFSSAFKFWKLKPGNDSRSVCRCPKVMENPPGHSGAYSRTGLARVL